MQNFMHEPGAVEMTGWQLLCSRTRRWWVRFSRLFPRLVWHGDEIDVQVTFSEDKLACDDPNGAFRQLFSGGLHEIEQQFVRMGITFDSGIGCGGRDWEWDWSLGGPISVTFRSRARRPEKRIAKLWPQLRLVS